MEHFERDNETNSNEYTHILNIHNFAQTEIKIEHKGQKKYLTISYINLNKKVGFIPDGIIFKTLEPLIRTKEYKKGKTYDYRKTEDACHTISEFFEVYNGIVGFYEFDTIIVLIIKFQ